MDNSINWQAKWIGMPDNILLEWRSQVQPAPYLRKVFNYDVNSKDCRLYISGLGYYELYLNGRRVRDHVLDPVVTHYDRRTRYVVYDVTEYLMPGKNVIGVILGNGWYNCHTADVWHFDKASWRDYPKLLLQLECDSGTTLISDKSWSISSGPIVFDGLRNGEKYDARLELGDWLSPEYDDSQWKNAAVVNPPGGILCEQTMPPCKVMGQIFPIKEWDSDKGERVYDFGQNFTGWVKLTVSGASGTELTIRYSELIKDNELDQSNINIYILEGDTQTDHYILKGAEQENYEPRFTYHGFRYLSIKGNAQILKIEGQVVHTSFSKIGKINSSNEILNSLQKATVWSYSSNFTGIPTDCPHREKNGWTGDAQLAVETGLFNFSSGTAYKQWLENFRDIQRPSGQLPGIIPSSGWGFNWGSGPAWDSAFIVIAWNVYIFTGDISVITENYERMKLYVDYCSSMAENNLVSFGLGDWCRVDKARAVSSELTSTAYFYLDTMTISKMADLQGNSHDCKKYASLAMSIRSEFNRKFYQGNGVYDNGEMTALAAALYFNLAEDSEKSQIAAQLAKLVIGNNYKADFGILGAKYIPRVLADYGYIDDAFELITQTEFPGWGHWIKQGATTLWENWDGSGSQNHIAFGDISAWAYQYLGGITPSEKYPGFAGYDIKTFFPNKLEHFFASYDSPHGTIASEWHRNDINVIDLELITPKTSTARLQLPHGYQLQQHVIQPFYDIPSGKSQWKIIKDIG